MAAQYNAVESDEEPLNHILLKEEDNSDDVEGYICLAYDEDADDDDDDDIVTDDVLSAEQDGIAYEDDMLETVVEYVEEDDEANVEDMQLLNTYTLAQSDDSVEVYNALPGDFVAIEELTGSHVQLVKTEVKEEESIIADQQWSVVEEVQEESEEFLNRTEHGAAEQIVVDPAELVDTATEKALLHVQYAEGEHENETVAEHFDVVLKQELLDEADEDDSDKYYCCECQSVFGDLESAEEHNCLSGNNEELNVKDLANNAAERKGFANGFEYVNSQLKQRAANQFKCMQCDKVFSSIKSLNNHNRSHKQKLQNKNGKLDGSDAQTEPPVVCPICNITFALKKYLKLHMKIHDKRQKHLRSIEQALPAGAKTQYSEMNKFFCEICNKSFEQNLLAIHKNMHQHTEEYNCRICNRHFENQPSYEMHMQMHAEKPIKERAITLVSHIRKFPCQYCGRAFSRPYEKVRHERVHTGEKPHECEVCGKTFRVSYSLTLHLRTHTDIRPFVCATCNKRFKSQSVYAHHLRTHQSDRPYQCDLCSKSFRTSVQLGAHKNSHLKPYNCPECNRPFATLYAVKIHIKTHNKVNKTSENLKHSCAVCGAVYARIFALRLHMKEQHSIDLNTTQNTDLHNGPTITDDDNDDGDEVGDAEAAVLIAAAAEADCAAYIEAANTATTSNSRLNMNTASDVSSVMEQDILQNEEIIVDNYQAEEIVADW